MDVCNVSAALSCLPPTYSLDDLVVIEQPLLDEKIASDNISLLACYPLQEWRFFAVRKNDNEQLQIVPERTKLTCTNPKTVLKIIDLSFGILQQEKNQRFAFLKDRVIEKIRKHGKDLSQVGRDDEAEKFLALATKWQ
jgi:hypothetical protein